MMNAWIILYCTLILMVSSSLVAMASSLVRAMRRILSRASEALEISSLRKIYKRTTTADDEDKGPLGGVGPHSEK